MDWNRSLLPALLYFCYAPLYSQNWQQTGDGLVYASHLFVDTATNELVAGGCFFTPDGDTICGLGKRNGGNWELFAPVSGDAFFNDIVSYGGGIVVGGDISSLHHLSKWDGGAWGPVGTLVADIPGFFSVRALHVFDGQLYIGGYLTDTSGILGIVRYDGVDWHDMQTGSLYFVGLDDPVTAIQDFNGELYLGGKFSYSVDGWPTYNISRWNGQEWNPVGTGLGIQGVYEPVRAFAVYDGSLYIAGNFGPELYIGTKSRHIARWDGSGYHRLSATEPCCIKDMVVYQGELYALVRFEPDSDIGATNLAKWDGSSWCSLETIFNGPAFDLEVYDDTLYVAGAFTKINGVPMRSVAKWTGGDFVGACSEPLSSDGPVPPPGGIRLGPNPFRGPVVISIPDSLPGAEFAVHDLTGRTLHQQRLAVGQNTVELAGLPPGIYFYEVGDVGKVLQAGKLVKVE